MSETVFALGALLWVGGWIGVSVVYRLANGKPIFARSPPDCVFEENRTSGRELGGLSALGGASNVLKVCVTPDTLYVMPCFPFSLMFLPEVWRLEHRIAARLITGIDERKSFFGFSQIVRTTDGLEIELRLRNPEGFKRAIDAAITL